MWWLNVCIVKKTRKKICSFNFRLLRWLNGNSQSSNEPWCQSSHLKQILPPPLIKVLKPWNKGVQIMHDFRHLAHFHNYFANFRNMYWNIEAKLKPQSLCQCIKPNDTSPETGLKPGLFQYIHGYLWRSFAHFFQKKSIQIKVWIVKNRVVQVQLRIN